MAKYISPKDTATEVRKALKAAFPDTKFSVRTHTYAGGASINVNYFDGPNQKAVEEVAKQFEGASFDGMIDLKSYHDSEYNGEMVHWGADYVFVNRDFSPEVIAQAEEFTRLAIEADGGDAGPGWWGEFPQAFYRARKDDEFFRWETNFWALRNIAASWLVEGRALAVKVA